MSIRSGVCSRETAETKVHVVVRVDGRGTSRLQSGLGFLEHMLTLFSRHSRISLEITATGDLHVDDHHLTEDLGICLGRALDQALGERRGINRYGSVLMPMDEVLVATAVDLGGRFSYCSDYAPRREMVGDLSTEMVDHFFQSAAVELRANLHFRFLNQGSNEHHRIEAMFKGFARALREACEFDSVLGDELPSSKEAIG